MKIKERKTYIAHRGAPFPRSAAQKVGRRLEQLRKRYGVLKPEHVVEDAESADSPFHPYFTWDDEVAARERRLDQARRIIGAVEVIVMVEDREVQTRQFHNVYVVDADEDAAPVRGYVSLERIESDARLRGQVIDDAIRAAEYFLGKYRSILDACKVVPDIEKVIEKLRDKAA